ncbi:MAG: multidrug effflux MFS transporter [Proteobacteria bacterium]|nr:multidrug effflux MFS transporter [Pseudomonadota bacterium]
MVVVAGLAVLGPLSISAYFPAFPAIAETFGASAGDVRLTLSVYLLGFCLAQLVYGPVSDAWGRRPVMVVGLTLFVAGSLGCLGAIDIDMLIASRLLQGMGACAGLVLGRAVVRDRLEGPAMTRMLAVMALALTAAPMLGPLVGGALETWFGWRAVFVLLTVLGVSGLLGVATVLPETRGRDVELTGWVTAIGRRYAVLAADWRFMVVVMSAGFVTAHVYLWGAGAPALFISLLGFTPGEFGMLGLVTGFGNLCVSLAMAAGRIKTDPVVLGIIGTIGISIGGLVLLGLCAAGWWTNPVIVLLPIVLISACAGLANVALASLAMAKHGAIAGAASAVLGAGQMAMGAAGVLVLALQDASTPTPMAFLMTVAAFGGAVAAGVAAVGLRRAR